MRRDRLWPWAVLAALLATSGAPADEVGAALERARQANARKDFATARDIYGRLAEDGHPEGLVHLGLLHAAGAGVARDRVRACDLFQQAAGMAFGPAQHMVGDCFFHGNGRPRDYATSKAWYEKAIAAGHVKANCALGNQYMLGLGVPRDRERGMALCRKAADQGDADAQTDLAEALLAQPDAPAHAEAFALLTKAAATGHVNATMQLARMYWNGDSTGKDRAAAARLFRIAWKGRRPEAAFPLGQYYFTQAVDTGRRQVEPRLGLQAMYWLATANRADPDPANRQKAAELGRMLEGVAPRLKEDLAAWLKTSQEPPPLPD